MTDEEIRALLRDRDEEVRRAARFALYSMFEVRRDLARQRLDQLLAQRMQRPST